jgi:sulfur-oxidizing protein SoxZ
MALINTRISVPRQVKANTIVEIKTLVSHPMESGYRYDYMGEPIARNILMRFTCEYLGQPVLEAEFGPGIAANPFMAFNVLATKTGELVFTWTDQHGEVSTETRTLQVGGT